MGRLIRPESTVDWRLLLLPDITFFAIGEDLTPYLVKDEGWEWDDFYLRNMPVHIFAPC